MFFRTGLVALTLAFSASAVALAQPATAPAAGSGNTAGSQESAPEQRTTDDLARFAAALPDRLETMERRPVTRQPAPGDRVVAYYEGAAGRGTVTVSRLSGGVSDGVSERASGELFIAMGEDLRRGTQALGPDYQVSKPTTFSLNVTNGPSLFCGLIERRANTPNAGGEPLRLINRTCVTAVDNHLLLLFVTAPVKNAIKQQVERAQLAFLGGMADQIIDRLRAGGAPSAQQGNRASPG